MFRTFTDWEVEEMTLIVTLIQRILVFGFIGFWIGFFGLGLVDVIPYEIYERMMVPTCVLVGAIFGFFNGLWVYNQKPYPADRTGGADDDSGGAADDSWLIDDINNSC